MSMIKTRLHIIIALVIRSDEVTVRPDHESMARLPAPQAPGVTVDRIQILDDADAVRSVPVCQRLRARREQRPLGSARSRRRHRHARLGVVPLILFARSS